MPRVYAELRRIADSYLRHERGSHTLQPPALVHEAWLRIAGRNEFAFEHRKQFFGLAAQVMRRVLVDHGRFVLGATKRFSRGHRWQLSYTFGKTTDETQGYVGADATNSSVFPQD